MQTAEEYSKNHYGCSPETARLTLSEAPPPSPLLSLGYLWADSVAQITGELKHIRESAFKYLTTPKICQILSTRQKVALIKVLFLSVSPEIKATVESPWLLTYLFNGRAEPSNEEMITLSACLPSDEVLTFDEFRQELAARDCAITQIAELFRMASTTACPAAFPTTFDDAASVWKERRNSTALNASPELKYCDSMPYNRYHQHHLVEIDARRPKKELLEAFTAIVDDLQQDIRTDEECDNDGEEWEKFGEKRIRNALAAYHLIDVFGWKNEEDADREAVIRIEKNKGWQEHRRKTWEILHKRLVRIGYSFERSSTETFLNDMETDETFFRRMEKWKQEHRKLAEKHLEAARQNIRLYSQA